MATLVLVHGAMHGGWCWQEVGPRLRGRGHRVHTPTLTGQGDRRQSLRPEVGVDTHVRDLVDVLWFEDLHDVTLVLHSYSGVLAGPVAEHAGDRLARIVFLGGFVTRPGQCLLDVEPPEVAARYRQMAADDGDGWLVRASTAFLEQWSVPPELRALVGPRLTDFPLRCATDPTEFDAAALAALACVYVHHTAPPLASLDHSLDTARAAGWPVRELACGHDMMLAAPVETTALLDEVARS